MSKRVLKISFLISTPVPITERQIIHSINEMTTDKASYSKYKKGGETYTLYLHFKEASVLV